MTSTPQYDVVIVGGGVAGLWVLDLLRRRGYSALLLEAHALGNAQTMASQGMIHGGIKYALGASLTGASEAIARMPERWRSCLAGRGDVDLRGVKVVANQYHMWSDGKLGKLSSFFASLALRGRIDALEPSDFPSVFKTAEFSGTVHALNDLVLDVNSLLQKLASNHRDYLIAGQVSATQISAEGDVESVQLADGREISAHQFIFTAGAGNAAFADALRNAGHSQAPLTQLRPLHQAFVTHPDLQELYAHCITGIRSAEPRLTITTHPLAPHKEEASKNNSQNTWGWYIGGHLATAGVKRSAEAQVDVTRRELAATLPWIDWSKAQVSTLRIDRAEPRQQSGRKPDEACVVRCGNAMLCWPTKLSLVPDLGDQVLNAQEPPIKGGGSLHDHPPGDAPRYVPVAQPPWLQN